MIDVSHMVSRRRYLQTTGSLALLTTAGCLSNGENDGDGTGDGGVDGELFVSVTTDDETVDALSHDHVATVGNVSQDGSSSAYTLAVSINDEGIDSLRSALESVGGFADPDAVELRVHHDDEVLNTFGLESNLADSLESGEFGGVFVLVLATEEDAQSLKSTLEG